MQTNLLEICERPRGGTHAESLRRVKTNIAPTIRAFLAAKGVSALFSMRELTDYVCAQHDIAPDSAGRILRDMNQRGEIGYELVSRPQSLYRGTAIQTEAIREAA